MRRRGRATARRWGLLLAFEALAACSGPPERLASPGHPSGSSPSVFSVASYANPRRFVEREVTIAANPPLTASLTMPLGADGHSPAAPPPAALLVSGWGATERDGTVGRNKPMRDIAWGLATRGIAVLRYDPPRALDTMSTASPEMLTVNVVSVTPAAAALRWLLERREVDGRRVAAVGHSLGALVVARLAQREPRLAGLVLMAAASRPLEEVLVDQLRYVSRLDGVTTRREQAMIAELEQQARRVGRLAAGDPVPADQLPLGLAGPFWEDLRNHPTGRLLADDRRPVLVLHGGRDYQVTDEDLAGWQALLRGRANASFQRYPSLNHLFVAGEGPSGPTEYRRAGHVAEQVIVDLATWLSGLPPAADELR